jgi:hypothetical protein
MHSWLGICHYAPIKVIYPIGRPWLSRLLNAYTEAMACNYYPCTIRDASVGIKDAKRSGSTRLDSIKEAKENAYRRERVDRDCTIRVSCIVGVARQTVK